MFDIGWSEMLVIAVVTILVVGPRDLPRMLRTIGQIIGKLRRMAGDFQHQFNDALREAELDEVKQSIESARSAIPRNPIRDSLAEIGRTEPAPSVPATAAKREPEAADKPKSRPAKAPAKPKAPAARSKDAAKPAAKPASKPAAKAPAKSAAKPAASAKPKAPARRSAKGAAKGAAGNGGKA